MPHFIYLCIDGWIFEGIVNNATNEHVCIHFVWICVFNFLEHIARNEVVKLHDNSAFNLLRYC